jgi:Leucine-rich repeat (LRR) protein
MVYSQSLSCSCQLDGTGMTMICDSVDSIIAYQQCIHEQLNSQSDLKLRRGGVITNLTIRYHQLRSLSTDLLQFSYGNHFYQLNDLRYLHIIHGTLKQIDNRSLSLIERALEHLDLSNNELQQMPKISSGNEQSSNLMYVNLIDFCISKIFLTFFRKLILSNNQIHRLTLSDIRAYHRLQYLDLSSNRLQFIDMTIINYLTNLKQLYLNSNMLRTLTNNITFPNNFHLKLSSNPFECDCRIRWLRNALNRLEYPIYHDEPQCEMPKALADKKIISLRDEQFVCGPIISKPDLTSSIATTGESTTLRCDVRSSI